MRKFGKEKDARMEMCWVASQPALLYSRQLDFAHLRHGSFSREVDLSVSTLPVMYGFTRCPLTLNVCPFSSFSSTVP